MVVETDETDTTDLGLEVGLDAGEFEDGTRCGNASAGGAIMPPGKTVDRMLSGMAEKRGFMCWCWSLLFMVVMSEDIFEEKKKNGRARVVLELDLASSGSRVL